MTTPIGPRFRPRRNPGLDVEYLLKELEFQFAIETKARDRMENMVQYLLTSIAAVIGAALLVNQSQTNSILLLFIATSLAFIFSFSAFYRSCRLRYILTYARVTRNNIRCLLKKLGIPEADLLIKWEGNPSGFCFGMLKKLILLIIVCCVMGWIAGGFAIMLILGIKEWPDYLTSTQQIWLIVGPIVVMVIIGSFLVSVLVTQKTKSEKFIPDPNWRELPDYDL